MEINQTPKTATHVVLHKGIRPCVTMPEADATAYAEKLGKDYAAVPLEAWQSARALAADAPAPTTTQKAAPAPKPATRTESRFTVVPNGFGGTTTVKAVDVPVPAPATESAYEVKDELVLEMVLRDFADRKFEVTDVTAELRAFATEWAKRWTGGDFQFMIDMRTAAKRGLLSVGQAKGTLNCYRADALRNAPKPAVPGTFVEPTKEEVPDSRYALEGADGVVTFYQVTTWNGRRYLKTLVGSVGDFVKYPIANAEKRAQIWNTLRANPASAAKLFSRKHTVCAKCGSPLSDIRSRATAFGETCANNLGVRYISDEAEARRVCQEEGISLAGLLLEALGADGETI